MSQERRIEIVARADNANGARGQGSHGWVPIITELVRPHSDYMHGSTASWIPTTCS